MEETIILNIGKKIERIRTMRGIKQDALASVLGITQAAVSKMEQSEKISKDKLTQVAQALGVTVDAIKNFDELSAINIVSSNFNDNSSVNHNCTLNINPIEKWLEAIEENKKLYERLLVSEQKRNEVLENLLKKKDM